MRAPTKNHFISWEIIDSPCCYPFLEREKDAGMPKKGQNWLRRFKNAKG
jgi:hypothetical protein